MTGSLGLSQDGTGKEGEWLSLLFQLSPQSSFPPLLFQISCSMPFRFRVSFSLPSPFYHLLSILNAAHKAFACRATFYGIHG